MVNVVSPLDHKTVTVPIFSAYETVTSPVLSPLQLTLVWAETQAWKSLLSSTTKELESLHPVLSVTVTL